MMRAILSMVTMLLATTASADITITATNKLPFDRKSQTIELTGDMLKPLNAKALNTVRVKDSADKELLTQPVDIDFDPFHKHDIVIFQADFAASESKTFTVSVGDKVLYKPTDFKAHGRLVKERFDDFAWENDRIAHRTYGADLATWKGESLISNTIDIWSKRTTRMVQDEWYMVDDYHRDVGEGADFYSAGRSRGCGADGLWAADQLWVGRNFVRSRVLSNGPIRVLFELDYDAWDVNNKPVAATRRISLDAGSNLDHIVVKYDVQGPAIPLMAGIGLKKVAGEQVDYNAQRGALTKFEKVEKSQGMQGLALIANPKAIEKHTEDKLNQLLLVKLDDTATVDYWAGFYWDKAGHFDGYEAWKKYVDECAQGAASPIEVISQ